MSTSIDNRVVEMKFDNSNFEKNVATTRNTLEKFKEALNISSSAETFNKSLNTAVNGVSFDKMADSLSFLEQRFSNLGIVGMTVLQNLTNTAVNAAKNMVSAATNAIIQGGKTRAQNIENAKFQLEGFNVAWKKIQADIDYGVTDTAYGLDSAAMAASQLVASGVEFGEKFGATGNSPMAKALRGISGLSAMTNSSFEDMSRIFTTVAGNGRLMGEQLLQISSRGVNAAATMVDVFNGVNAGSKEYNNISDETKKKIKELTNGLNITETELRDFVSKGKIDFAMFSEAMDASFGAHAKDANNTLQGVLSNIRSALAKIGADFWTPIIENNGTLVEALKSLKSRINDVKEAIREYLGWAENDEGIGYLTKWKDLIDKIFTNLKKYLDGIDKEKLATGVKTILSTVINLGKGFVNIFKSIKKYVSPVVQAFKEIFHIKGTQTVLNALNIMSSAFSSISKRLIPTGQTMSKIRETARGIFAVADIGWTILKGIFGVVKDIVKTILPAGDNVLTISKWLGNLLVKIDNFVQKTGFIETFFETVSTIITSSIKAVSNFFKNIYEGFAETAFGAKNATEGFKKFGDKITEVFGKIKEFVTEHFPKFSESGLQIGKVFGNVAKFVGNLFGKLVEFTKAIAPGIKEAISGIASLLDGLADNIIKIFNNLDTGKAFSLVNGGLFAGLMVGLDKFILSLSNKGTLIGNVLGRLTWNIQQAIGADGTRAALIKNFAISMAILAGSLFVLASIDPERLTAPLAALTALLWQLAAVLKILTASATTLAGTGEGKKGFLTGFLNSISGGINFKNMAKGMAYFALGIGALAIALRIIAELKPEQIAAGIVAVTILINEMVYVTERLAKQKNKMLQGASAMIPFATGIAILAASVRILAKLNWSELARGLIGFSVILGGIVSLSVTLEKTGSDKAIRRIGLAMIPFAAGVVILSAAVRNLANMSWEELAKGLLSLVDILGSIAGFTIVLDKTNADLAIGKIGLAMIPFAAGVVILSAALRNLANLSWDELGRGLTGFAGVLASVAATAVVLDKSNADLAIGKIGLALIPFSLGVVLLSASLKNLSGLSWNEMAVGLTGLAGVLSGIFAFTLVMDKTNADLSMARVAGGLLIFAVAMRVFTPVMKAFASLSWEDMAKSLLMLAGTFTVLGLAGLILKPVVPTIMLLGAAVTLLGIGCLAAGAGILLFAAGIASLGASFGLFGTGFAAFIKAILSVLPEIVKAIGKTIEAIADVIGSSLPSIVKSVVALIKAGCQAIIEALPMILDTILKVLDYLVQYVPKITDKVITLIISVIDSLGDRLPDILQSIVGFLSKLMGAVLDLFKGMSLKDFATAIMDLAGTALILAIVGKTGAAAIKGLAILGIIIAGLGVILTALGALVTYVPEVQEFVENGIPLLEKIGYALGSFIGNIVGGLLGGISSGLPVVGENLSKFMTNLQPFLDGIKQVDSSVAQAALNLAATILVLTGAELLEGIASFLLGESDFGALGDQLVPFGESMKKFADSVVGLDAEVVNNAAQAGLAIAAMASALPNSGGVAGFFAGENDMDIVGPQIASFGEAIMGFAEATKGLDGEVVTNAANAGKAIAEMAAALPNQGGVAGFFAGENNMDIIGPQLEKFGEAMSKYAKSVEGINPESVTNSANAGKALAAMASELPNSGGVAGFFAGENDMDDFGKKLVKFGAAMKLYSIAIIGIDPKVVEASAVAGTAIAKMAADIPNTGGVAGFFAGNNDIDEFAKKLIPFGQALKDYSDVISGINSLAVWGTAIAGAALVELAKKMGGSKAEIMELNGIDFTSFGKQLNSFGKGIIEYSNTISDVNYEAVQSTTAVISELIETLIKAASLDAQAGARFSQALSGLAKAGISGFTKTFDSDGKKEAMEAAKRFLVAFADAKNNAYGAGKAIADQVIKALKEYDNSFARAGSDNVAGYIMGMRNRESDVYREGYRVGVTALEAAKKAVDSNSPSKKFFKLGGDNMIGLANGMAKNVGLVTSTAEDVSKQALVRVANVVSNMQDIFDNNDIRPVIRPVLDSSEIQNGLSNINSYISRSSVAVGATSYGLASRINQNPYLANNGYNDSKVVSAIGTLEGKLEDMTKRLENMQVVLSTGELVGGLSPGINKNLGKMDMLSQRGVV